MIYREIVHTCSNINVANAAVASIGGQFATDFAEDANRREMSRGAFAAHLVREFASCADEREWRRLAVATRGSDYPILSGLRYILDRARRDSAPPAWMIAATLSPA